MQHLLFILGRTRPNLILKQLWHMFCVLVPRVYENMDVGLMLILTHHLFVWQLLLMLSERAWAPKAWTRWSVKRFWRQAYFSLLPSHRRVSKAGAVCLSQIQDEKGDVTITNDGATILKQMQVLHPAAIMVRSTRHRLTVLILLHPEREHPFAKRFDLNLLFLVF